MARSPSAANTRTRAAFPSQPTDLDLVNTYLRPWVETGVKAAPFIHQADVYAADPADLTRQFTPAVAQDGERAWYFYTSLRHKSVRGKRKARSAASGTGCWHNEAKSKPVYTGINGKRQIGYRQSFSFVKKYGNQRIRTGWLMIELRLFRKDCAGQEAKENEEGALEALCKVYRSPRNPEDRDAGGNPEGRYAGNPEPRDAAPAARNAEAADDDESRPRDADHAAALPGRKAEADGQDGESSSATESNDAGRKSDEEISSEATAAPSRHSQAERGIFGAAAAARIEKASGCEDSAVASAAAAPAPALKRKLSEDGSSGAPAPARKKRADGSTSPGEAAPTTEMHCPHCGTHLIVTMKRPETEAAKDDAVGAANTTTPTQFHEWL